ncbi:MAG: RecQ family ATP-dependent DNA helicase, partial [Verrucomicrobiota bacterium]
GSVSDSRCRMSDCTRSVAVAVRAITGTSGNNSRKWESLPDVPVMALTATATERVQSDILQRLSLTDPTIFIASFNRPNLTYRVTPKQKPLDQIIKFLGKRQQEAGIIYCASRKGTEKLAESLQARGLSARPYHAGLASEERAANQEAFLRDEVKTICATIAFGMGINKPNVRYVIHHDLPKNLESYYQETGRAGRDGLPSDCLLLFSAGDAAKQTHFIEEISDPNEQQNARLQLNQVIHYAESTNCRRVDLLSYFGESWTEIPCGACDNCLSPPETYDGTIPAQKFLSCVFRIKRQSGYGVGINHIVEVLTGAQTEKIRQRGHETLSTYGIGKDLHRKEWQAIGRELLRLGLLCQTPDKFSVLELTREGFEILKTRDTITLTKPVEILTPRTAHKQGEIECDEVLFAVLRQVRKELADERSVPAYIIFGDTTLRQMARYYPTTDVEFSNLSGVGEKKRKEFGERFIREVTDYLETNPRVSFSD